MKKAAEASAALFQSRCQFACTPLAPVVPFVLSEVQMDTDTSVHQLSNLSTPSTTQTAYKAACQHAYRTHAKQVRRHPRTAKKKDLSNEDRVRWFIVVSLVVLMFVAFLFAYMTNNAWFIAGGSVLFLAVGYMMHYYFSDDSGEGKE